MPAVFLGRWLAGISARDCGRLGWQKWWHRHTKGNLERRVQPSVPRAALGSATLVPPSSIGRSPLGHRPATSAEATTGPAGPRGRERPRENYITAIKTCVRDLEEAVRGNGNVRLESNPIAGHSLLHLFCRRPHHAKLPSASPRRILSQAGALAPLVAAVYLITLEAPHGQFQTTLRWPSKPFLYSARATPEPPSLISSLFKAFSYQVINRRVVRSHS